MHKIIFTCKHQHSKLEFINFITFACVTSSHKRIPVSKTLLAQNEENATFILLSNWIKQICRIWIFLHFSFVVFETVMIKCLLKLQSGIKMAWKWFGGPFLKTKNKDMYKDKINSSHCILYIQTLDHKFGDGRAQNILKDRRIIYWYFCFCGTTCSSQRFLHVIIRKNVDIFWRICSKLQIMVYFYRKMYMSKHCHRVKCVKERSGSVSTDHC